MLIVYLLLLPWDGIVLRPPELLILGVGHTLVIDGPWPRSHQGSSPEQDIMRIVLSTFNRPPHL